MKIWKRKHIPNDASFLYIERCNDMLYAMWVALRIEAVSDEDMLPTNELNVWINEKLLFPFEELKSEH